MSILVNLIPFYVVQSKLPKRLSCLNKNTSGLANLSTLSNLYTRLSVYPSIYLSIYLAI